MTFPAKDHWVLVNTSSDTVWQLFAEGQSDSSIVRTPSNSPWKLKSFFSQSIITDRYYFMRTMKKELDYKTFKGFPGTDLVYDDKRKKQSSTILYVILITRIRNRSSSSKPKKSRNTGQPVSRSL